MSPEISELTSFLNELDKHLNDARNAKHSGEESEEKKMEAVIKNAKRLRSVYSVFVNAGFTEQQAWELFFITYKSTIE